MLVAYFVLLIALTSTSATEVSVSTSLGDIRGAKMKSRLGEDFLAFRGIRYAKPPVGELRFKSPQPVDSWKPNVFDATEDGPRCPQGKFNDTENSEDCLRLNVYSKDLSGSKPVIVYIHPGGFYGFSSQSKNLAGPELLMDRDIVLVTINYRLGTLGFLSTGTEHAPGNAGMKDQVEALRWVRDHISKFGGDPHSVTLMGYSAGSMSIGLHMASPMAKGLFHKGIGMSASPVIQMNYGEDQLYLAKRQAELVKCPTTDIGAMVKCLRETPVEEFLKTFVDMFDFGYNPVLNWLPVIEKDFGQERYLTEDPVVSYQTGRIQRTPLIIGMTKDEFVRIIYWVLKNEMSVQQLNEDWERLAPIILQYERDTPRSKEASRVLRKEYLDDKPLVKDGPFEPMGKLFSDGVIGFGVHRFAQLAARFVPVHYYKFTYKGRFSDFKYPGDMPYGTVHHDDLQYLLWVRYIAPKLIAKSDPEDKTIERVTRMWTQFAKTGDPNNKTDEYLKDLDWSEYDVSKDNYLDIGDYLEMKNGLFPERFAIWEKLFPLDWSCCLANNTAGHDSKTS